MKIVILLLSFFGTAAHAESCVETLLKTPYVIDNEFAISACTNLSSEVLVLFKQCLTSEQTHQQCIQTYLKPKWHTKRDPSPHIDRKSILNPIHYGPRSHEFKGVT